MGFAAACTWDHGKFNADAYARPEQRAKKHRMTTRPASCFWLLLAHGGQRREPDRFGFTASRINAVGSRIADVGIVSRSSFAGWVWASPHVGAITTRVSRATSTLCMSSSMPRHARNPPGLAR